MGARIEMAANDERKSRTRDRILDAAARHFAANGYAATPTQSIAEEAGVAHGTVFWHFNSKPQLYAQVLNRVGQRVVARMQPLALDTTSLHDLLERWADILQSDAELRGILVGGAGDARDPALTCHVQQLDETLLDFWRATLARLADRDQLPADTPVEAFARLIVSASCGMLGSWCATNAAAIFALLAETASSATPEDMEGAGFAVRG